MPAVLEEACLVQLYSGHVANELEGEARPLKSEPFWVSLPASVCVFNVQLYRIALLSRSAPFSKIHCFGKRNVANFLKTCRLVSPVVVVVIVSRQSLAKRSATPGNLATWK